MRVQLFLHAKPRHAFSVHQHTIMLVLRQYQSRSYESFVEWLGSSDAVCGDLGLPHVPHYATPHRATRRLGAAMLRLAAGRFFSYMFYGGTVFAGINATGFETRHAAACCARRAGIRHECTKMSACRTQGHSLSWL